MPTPPLSSEKAREAAEAVEKHGTVTEAAKALGIARSTLQSRYKYAKIDPAIQAGMAAVGANMVPSTVWAKTKSKDGTSYSVMLRPAQEDVTDRIRQAFEGITAATPIPAPQHALEDLLTTYALADVHLGMMAWGRETGEDYDTNIASERVKSWVGQCVASSPDAAQAVILDVGDYLHADSQDNQTPRSKHILDVDTRHYRTLEVAIETMIAAVDLALQKHQHVTVVILPGNHDPHAYLAVLFATAERYRDEPRVTVHKSPSEFWAFEFGKVMLAAHHGDKAKAQRLVLHMADSLPEVWGRTRYRFLFSGHLHHHKSEDIGGVTWEQLRAVTAKDAYAASHAYSARSEMQAITYHKDKGEVTRVRVAS